MENQSSFENFELSLNNQAIEALKESAKWCYFLAILGFIGIGLMLLGGFAMFSMGSTLSQMGGMFGAIGGVLGFVYIIMAAIYFFPVLYLFRYATKMKTALANSNSATLSESLVNLKSHHKFLGIGAIVFILLYIIGIVFVAVSGMSRMV